MSVSLLPNEYYTFECMGGNVTVSRGMVIRLCQEGHIFRMLLLGGKMETINTEDRISFLKEYNIQCYIFSMLVFALRINEPKMVYKYKIILEAIGGFKFIDRYVKMRQESDHSFVGREATIPFI